MGESCECTGFCRRSIEFVSITLFFFLPYYSGNEGGVVRYSADLFSSLFLLKPFKEQKSTRLPQTSRRKHEKLVLRQRKLRYDISFCSTCPARVSTNELGEPLAIWQAICERRGKWENMCVFLTPPPPHFFPRRWGKRGVRGGCCGTLSLVLNFLQDRYSAVRRPPASLHTK